MAKVDNIANFIKYRSIPFHAVHDNIRTSFQAKAMLQSPYNYYETFTTVKVWVLTYIKRTQEVVVASESKEFWILANIKCLESVTTTEEIIEFRTM